MKIDTDLRLAIKSAEKAQPDNSWEQREKLQRALIAELLNSKPQIKKSANRLAATARAAYKKYIEAGAALCKEYGLQYKREGATIVFELASCGDGQEAYQKLGGKVAERKAKWSFNDVMTKLAAATPSDGAKIIKSLGINWE